MPDLQEITKPRPQIIWRARSLMLIFALVFGCDFLVMMILPLLGFSEGSWEAVMDSALLAALIVPGMAALGLIQKPTLLAKVEKISHEAANLETEVRNRTAELELQKFALDEHAIVSITDIMGNIIYANDRLCESSGYTRAELYGQNHRIMKSDEHSPEVFQKMWLAISQGKTWRGEIKNRRKNGTHCWAYVTIVPFKNDSGKITRYIAIRTDITERKNAELKAATYAQELETQTKQVEAANTELRKLNTELNKARQKAEQAAAAKSDFLANMSHEIRTPMTAILGYAEILKTSAQEHGAPESCFEAVNLIQRNSEHLLNIINDILDLSKIEAGKMTVEIIDCALPELLATAASLINMRVAEKGLVYQTALLSPIPSHVRTDPTRLRQVLINLLGNAIKFTDKGTVRLEASLSKNRQPPMLQLDVVDTGIGMSQEQVAHIFQPFSQADTSTTRRFGGTGLGLTISRRFVELLDGEISIVESTPGVGTRFRVAIPTQPLEGATMVNDLDQMVANPEAITPTQNHIGPTMLQGCRILLADDGSDNRRLIDFILKKVGASVTQVENGKQALDTALEAFNQQNPFDVILMDMQMPVMDGYTATRQLRKSRYTNPIIALTAHAMAGDRQKCLDAGCDDYGAKPIDRIALLKAIQKHWEECPQNQHTKSTS